MIEAFWRSLRHQWLYLHSLESLLKQLIDLYVRELMRQRNRPVTDRFERGELEVELGVDPVEPRALDERVLTFLPL